MRVSVSQEIVNLKSSIPSERDSGYCCFTITAKIRHVEFTRVYSRVIFHRCIHKFVKKKIQISYIFAILIPASLTLQFLAQFHQTFTHLCSQIASVTAINTSSGLHWSRIWSGTKNVRPCDIPKVNALRNVSQCMEKK